MFAGRTIFSCEPVVKVSLSLMPLSETSTAAKCNSKTHATQLWLCNSWSKCRTREICLLFLICTIRDKIIWHGESKFPNIGCIHLSEETPSVNFKLPYFPQVYPQEIAITPVEYLVSGLQVIFWKILACIPDVEVAVKNL